MPLVVPSLEDIVESLRRRLRAAGFDDSSSSVVMLLARIVAEELAALYEQVQYAWQDARLSEATSEGLERAGQEKRLPRLLGETDENYRFRLSEAYMASAGANEAAIRQAALAVAGVQGVVMQPYLAGPGSAGVWLLVSDPAQQEAIAEQVRQAIREVAGYGTYIEVLLPDLVPVRIRVTLALAQGVDADSIRERARQAIRQYLGTRGLGEGLVITELIEHIQRVDDAIVDVAIDELMVDGELRPIANVTIGPTARIIPDPATDGVVVR